MVQQVTLDTLLERVERAAEPMREELLVEAAAVLAGTMLMASGTSGSGPDAHDSSTTLSTLLPRIAAYRDAFYQQFVAGVEGEHGARLRAEAQSGKQPLAGARQHLNQQLARRRAAQLERVHLALLFARMGYPAAAERQARIVPVASARMACHIQCRLTTAHRAIELGRLDEGLALGSEIEALLERAIQCGAMVDPWNVLGFQGQFSLFPAVENSVPDHRIEQLIETLEQIFELYGRLWSEAAAGGHQGLDAELARRMERLARWWDQFATTTVESVESFSGREAFESAREVAQALEAFHAAGAAAGDIAFWRKRVDQFNSPKAYALVLTAMLRKPDPKAATGLLMQWLSQASMMPLKEGEHSFHDLAVRVLQAIIVDEGPAATNSSQRSTLVRKFFDQLEANAEDFWQVPTLELLGGSSRGAGGRGDDDEDVEDGERGQSNLFQAAYDEVVYRDSTGDGIESDMLEGGPGPATDYELEQEARRVGARLTFLRSVAALWKQAALAGGPNSNWPLPAETLDRWLDQAFNNHEHLLKLLESVEGRRIPDPSASRDSLIEFDRRRALKDALAEKILTTALDTAEAARAVRAAQPRDESAAGPALDAVWRAVIRGDAAAARVLWPSLLEELAPRELLYVPLNKGGEALRMVQARSLQQNLRELLAWLPRVGMLGEACQLIEAARLMELNNPVGAGAISEFDRLFSAGYEAIVESLVAVSQHWAAAGESLESTDNELVECLEQVTESLVKQWLAHSRTLRLSALEKIADDKSWQSLVDFIERYGSDTFTQQFLNLGNLRAILHQGVDAWLERIEQGSQAEQEMSLVRDLGDKLPRAKAVKQMSLVVEAIVENYGEYRDYNNTTTQSDHGEMLYTLLDFLRLRVHYDRIAWHLKPVVAAHLVLVRRGRLGAAEMWRRALAERTAELADTLQKRCAELETKYAMRLPTITDRLAERFVRPLAIDRVRALIRPAIEEVRHPERAASRGGTFELLEQEVEELAQQPTGVGLDVPAWLASLEQEADERHAFSPAGENGEQTGPPIGQAPLDLADVQRQLTDWELHPR